MVILFEFEVREGVWEPVGTGDGEGEFAAARAFADLSRNSPEPLPPGRYRYRAGDGGWRTVDLQDDGELVDAQARARGGARPA